MPSQLRRNFWWLWFSLFAAVVSLVVLQSKILLLPSVASLGLALNRLLQSQMVITEVNDFDLELQPLETAGTIQHRRLTMYQALRMAFSNYMQGR